MGSSKRLFVKSSGGGGGTGIGWDDQVATRNDLPITTPTPEIGDIYLVEQPITVTVLGIPYKTYQSGLYIRDTLNGNLNDWKRLNVKVKFTSSEFRIVDPADTGKQFGFSASDITSGIQRTLTAPDKDGKLALLDDIPVIVGADARYTSSYTGNLNVNGDQDFPFDNEAFNESSEIFELDNVNGTVLIKQQIGLKAKIEIPHIRTSGNVQRAKILVKFFDFDSDLQIGVDNFSGYLRGSGGSTSSQSGQEYTFPNIPAGTRLRIKTERINTTQGGTITPISGSVFLELTAKTARPLSIPIIIDPTPGQTYNVNEGVVTGIQFAATGLAAGWSLSNEPLGLSINSSGLLLGLESLVSGTYNNIEVIAFNGAGTSSPVLFNLQVSAGIPAGAQLILQGESLDALADGAPIDQWLDDSGNGNTFQQVNLIDRPNLDRDMFGTGKHSVIFNGVNQFLQCINNTIDLTGSPSEGELWVVFRQNGVVANSSLVSFPRSSTTSQNNVDFFGLGLDVNYVNNGGSSTVVGNLSLRVREQTGPNYSVLNESGQTTILDRTYVRATYTSGFLNIYKEGVLLNTAAVLGSGFDGADGLANPVIGKLANVSTKFTATSIGLVLFFNRSLSTSEAAALDNFIQTEYDLS